MPRNDDDAAVWLSKGASRLARQRRKKGTDKAHSRACAELVEIGLRASAKGDFRNLQPRKVHDGVHSALRAKPVEFAATPP
jgi:hypothetical protein